MKTALKYVPPAWVFFCLIALSYPQSGSATGKGTFDKEFISTFFDIKTEKTTKIEIPFKLSLWPFLPKEGEKAEDAWASAEESGGLFFSKKENQKEKTYFLKLKWKTNKSQHKFHKDAGIAMLEKIQVVLPIRNADELGSFSEYCRENSEAKQAVLELGSQPFKQNWLGEPGYGNPENDVYVVVSVDFID